MKWKSLSCVQLFTTVWTNSPWNSQGQNTGVVAFPFSRGSSQPRDRTQLSTLQADSLPAEPLGAHYKSILWIISGLWVHLSFILPYSWASSHDKGRVDMLLLKFKGNHTPWVYSVFASAPNVPLPYVRQEPIRQSDFHLRRTPSRDLHGTWWSWSASWFLQRQPTQPESGNSRAGWCSLRVLVMTLCISNRLIDLFSWKAFSFNKQHWLHHSEIYGVFFPWRLRW